MPNPPPSTQFMEVLKLHALRIMDAREGDILVEFAPPEVKTKEAEATRRKAEEIFNQVMGRGMLVYAVDTAHEGTQVTKFDPAIKEMIAIPQVVGG